MLPRLTAAALVALLVLAGCVASPPAPPGTNHTATANASDGVAVPPSPDRPNRTTGEAVAAYANATETHRFYREAVDAGATGVDVTCSATTAGLAADAGYALVECGGSVYEGNAVGSVHRTAFYRVSADDERRIERVSTRDDGGDDDRRLRVYNFDDEERSVTVTVTPPDATDPNASTSYEYAVDAGSGATTTGLRLDPSVDAYGVTVAGNGTTSLSTRWSTGGEAGDERTTGVVVVTPDGDLLWGAAPA